MIRKKKLLAWLVFQHLCAIVVFGQGSGGSSVAEDGYRYIPKSPEAAHFEQMGNLSVNPSSGLPDIRVPLYSINLKGFSWDIHAGYHAKGFRVDDVASNVGLGWTLSLTGLISATVYGRSDVFVSLDSTSNGLKRNLQLGGGHDGQNLYYDNWADVDLANQALEPLGNNYLPDIFSLNIGAVNHRFFLKEESGGAINGYTMPASNLRIRLFRYVASSGALDSARFEVTDEAGTTYHLSARGSTITLNYCSGQRLMPSDRNYVFYLDRIRTINGEEINFKYKTSPALYLYQKSRSEIYSVRASVLSPCDQYDTNLYNQVCNPQFVVSEPLLDYITASDGTHIALDYAQRLDLDNRDGSNPLSAVSRLTITKHGEPVRSIQFDQGYFGSGPTPDDRRLKLNKIVVLDEDENPSTRQEYGFQYDATLLPNRLSLSQDSMGYFNHASNTNLRPSASNRNSVLTGSRACVLERITYPTGGHTTFGYRLSALPDKGLAIDSIMDSDGVSNTNIRRFVFRHPQQGGVESTWTQSEPVYFDAEGFSYMVSCIIDREYSYPYTTMLQNSIGRSEPFFGEVEEIRGSGGVGGKTVYTYGWQSPGWGITLLPVELREKAVYAHAGGANHYTLSQREKFAYSGKISASDGTFDEPLGIKEKRVFGKQVIKVHDEMYLYNSGEGSAQYMAYPAAYMQYPYSLRSIPHYQTEHETWTYNALSGDVVYTKVQQHYDNDWHGMPTRVVQSTSGTEDIIAVRAYPQDYATGTLFIEDMKSSNLLTQPIEQVSYREAGSVRTILTGNITTYKAGGKGLVDQVLALEAMGPVPLASFMFSNRPAGVLPPTGSAGMYLADPRYKAKITYNSYDNEGNPLQLTPADGPPISYLWGYGGRYPVAEVRNATYGEVTATGVNLAVLNSLGSTDAQRTAELDKVRNHTTMKKAQVSTYIYDLLKGLTSATDASGRATHYEYDGFGRLEAGRDMQGNIIEGYKYHYGNQ